MIPLFFTWKTILCWQYGPENDIGPTRNSYFDGTNIVEASILQAAAHAAWKACNTQIFISINFSLSFLSRIKNCLLQQFRQTPPLETIPEEGPLPQPIIISRFILYLNSWQEGIPMFLHNYERLWIGTVKYVSMCMQLLVVLWQNYP